ncbi:MAG TPA: carbohydrate porin [Steroidobacter sp.]|uniref:carbohydrate porin n=1 Tax=Steroidobacter sp. TaxID=1978227 RepID=UPI002ED9A2FA
MENKVPVYSLTCVVAAMFGSAALAESSFSDRLTGDWGGARARLYQRGMTVDLESAHYYQGLLSGSGDDDFDYAGRLDAFVNFDTGKLGLWKGGLLRTHTEYRYGDLSSNLGGTLIATNASLLLPTGAHEEVIVTSIHLAQRLGDRINLLIGRINALDLIEADPFFGGGGRSRFLNMAFSAPPSGVTPAVIMGAVATIRAEPINWTLMVFEPDDRTRDYWPDDFFGSGINVSVSASYAGEIFGHASGVTLTGTYSTKDGANLGELLLPADLRTGDKDHSWFLGVQFVYYLRQSAQQPAEAWGVFLKTAASDGNPNPFQGSIMGGIGGRGLFDSRPNDTFGLGYFYVNFSDELQSAIDPLVAFQDEQGIEAFYNYAFNEWLMLTADLQYVNPALGDTDNAFVAGLRATIRF